MIAVAHVTSGGRLDRRFGDRGVLDVSLGGDRQISRPLLQLDRRRHRLWLVADAGVGFTDIREDYGGNDVVLAAIKTP